MKIKPKADENKAQDMPFPTKGGTMYLQEHILTFYRLNVFCLI